MPVSSHKLARRYIKASTLIQAAKDVATRLKLLIQRAKVPVEARRFTHHFRELRLDSGGVGYLSERAIEKIVTETPSAKEYIFSDRSDRRQKQWDVENEANQLLQKWGVIGRMAR